MSGVNGVVSQPFVYGRESAPGEHTLFVLDRETRLSPWYFPDPISDDMACDALRTSPTGCFIVRASSVPKSFILSYW